LGLPGAKKALREAGTGCWQHQLTLALGTMAGIADHGAGRSVPDSDVVINMKQYSTQSWEKKKKRLCYY